MSKVERKATGRPKLVEDDETIRVGFTVPEGFWAEVIAFAEKSGRSYSDIIREALAKFLGKSSS